MFCPNCGNPDQEKNSYCRRCGEFLPDYEKPEAKRKSLEGMLQINNLINALTAIVSLALAVLLIISFSGEKLPPLIILTAAFLIAIFFWQWQSARRNERILDQLAKRQSAGKTSEVSKIQNSNLAAFKLDEAADESRIPASVTENTTKTLNKIPRE